MTQPLLPDPINLDWSSAEPAREDAAPAADTDLNAVNVFRGLTILEVVAHHTSGLALRYFPAGTPANDALTVLNQTLHFAVPAFVFLSAVVLTRSLLRRFRPGPYFTRRLVRGGWPYLLWSVLYALWYVWTGQRDAGTLTDAGSWQAWLLYGKASYHLYFLLVALEVYVILPLLLPLARRKPSITAALLIGAALQLGLYALNRGVLHLPFPASTALWFMLPVVVGLAVGARLDDFPAWWKRRRRVLLPLLAAVYGVYLPVALEYVRSGQVTPLLYAGLSWAYSTLVALALLGLALRLENRSTRLRRALARLGTVSLQVYLLHPAVLQALELWHAPDGPTALRLLTVAAYAAAALLLPLYAARLLRRTPLGPALFGR